MGPEAEAGPIFAARAALSDQRDSKYDILSAHVVRIVRYKKQDCGSITL
jgi:hypothetical protein